MSKVKKPSEAEAKAISKMFSSKQVKKRPFDPLSESVSASQQKKKKKAVPLKKSKPSNVKVFMLDKHQRIVPKGDTRKRLEKKDRVQVIKIYREMDADDLKETILNAFKWVRSYVFLTCESGGHTLMESDEQGPLYLSIKKCDDYVVGYKINFYYSAFSLKNLT